MKCIVRTLMGLESVLAEELKQLGAEDIQILTRAVEAEMTMKQVYAANYLLRTAIKVMIPFEESKIYNEHHLYNDVYNIAWEEIFNLNQTFAIDAVVHSDTFRHSHFVALKSKDAIADRFRDKFDRRPFVNPVNPDINIVIHIRQNILTILLDASGESLHMRGYRVYPIEAPLNEVLAAGMIMLSGWDRKQSFIDPMCGSGTLLIEAAMWAGNIPPQLKSRKYCFMNWKNYEAHLWKEIIKEAEENIQLENIPTIKGFDKQLKAVTATNTNAHEKKLEKFIKVDRKDFFVSNGFENTFVITNPPYDKRLQEDDIIAFYKAMGDKFKHHYKDAVVWILSGNIEALKHFGLRPSRRIPLLNGDLESGFYKYEIYEGVKKRKETINEE